MPGVYWIPSIGKCFCFDIVIFGVICFQFYYCFIIHRCCIWQLRIDYYFRYDNWLHSIARWFSVCRRPNIIMGNLVVEKFRISSIQWIWTQDIALVGLSHWHLNIGRLGRGKIMNSHRVHFVFVYLTIGILVTISVLTHDDHAVN